MIRRCCNVVLWLLLVTGEMMKWAHLGSRTENLIAIAQLTLSSGVGGIVMAFVGVSLSIKAYKVGTAQILAYKMLVRILNYSYDAHHYKI